MTNNKDWWAGAATGALNIGVSLVARSILQANPDWPMQLLIVAMTVIFSFIVAAREKL